MKNKYKHKMVRPTWVDLPVTVTRSRARRQQTRSYRSARTLRRRLSGRSYTSHGKDTVQHWCRGCVSARACLQPLLSSLCFCPHAPRTSVDFQHRSSSPPPPPPSPLLLILCLFPYNFYVSPSRSHHLYNSPVVIIDVADSRSRLPRNMFPEGCLSPALPCPQGLTFSLVERRMYKRQITRVGREACLETDAQG